MHIRPYQSADLDAIHSLISAAASTDGTPFVTHEALRTAPAPDQNTAVALLPNHTIAGFAWWDVTQQPAMAMEGWVHPAHRRQGLGTALLVAAESAARSYSVEHLAGRAFDNSPSALALFKLRGFFEARRFNQMWVTLGSAEIQVPSIAGFTVRTFKDGDAAELFDADVDVFSTSWGAQPQTFEAWQRRNLIINAFDPTQWVLVLEGSRIVALALCNASSFGSTATQGSAAAQDGWVSHLGVRAAYRGCGLGRLALLRGLWGLQQVGYQRVGLHVDAENTPAIRLYESVGMRSTRTRVHFAKAIR